jgi:hypothetical protein
MKRTFHSTCAALALLMRLPGSITPVKAEAQSREYAERAVTFDRANGPYRADAMARDFGNARPPAGRDFAAIRDGVLQVTFREGAKVTNTGLAAHIRVPDRPVYEVRFRLRYPDSFETGMHGKMIGLSGGRGYDGGRGDEARENGDGWSVRFQFDARDEDIRKTLYNYHSGMTGRYGGPMGATPFFVKRGQWNDYRLRITMQSSAADADGRIEVWCNEEKRMDLQNLQLVTREEGRNFNRVRLELFPGGGGVTPTRDHILEIDDFSWRGMTREEATSQT